MPLPKGAKVLGQKRVKGHLELFYKTKGGKVKMDMRKGCKCPKDKRKPCHCK